MDLLRRFSFAAQSACLLLLFVASGSYAMLSLSEKQIAYNQDLKSRLFIKDFPTMTLEQAGKRFGSYSPAVQESIVRMVDKKDRDNDNKLFSAAFCMATKLPQEIQELILKKEMFGGNLMATEKFLNMPIGKACEWYTFCQKASRGKLIYLPIFEKKLREKGLISIRRPLKHAVDLRDNGFEILLEDGFKIATLDANKRLNGLYNGDSYCCGDSLNNLLDDAAGLFFQLSKQDIILLMDYDENMHYGGKSVTINDLKQLVAIDQSVPFLKDNPRTIRYVKEYSRADVIDFIKIGAKNGMKYVFPVFAIPLCCAGLSKFIETKFCQKVWSESIAEDNACIKEKIQELDKVARELLKDGSVNNNLLIGMSVDRGYLVNQLRNSVWYSLTDRLKMGLPLLFSIPMGIDITYKIRERDWLKKGLAVGAVLFVWASYLSDSWFVQDSKSFAISIGAVGALSVVSGILWNICEEYFSCESRVNGKVKSKAIKALLESIDTKKSKPKTDEK